MPRGPRRNLRPVAESMSQPIRADVDRHLADRLAGVEQERHARSRASAPTAAAGLTRPPCVGTWTSETSLPPSASTVRGVDVEPGPAAFGTTSMIGAGAVGDLAQRDVVARVLGAVVRMRSPGRSGASRRPCPTRAWRSRRSRSRRARSRSAARSRRSCARCGPCARPPPRSRRSSPRGGGARSPRRAPARAERGAGVVEVGDLLDAGRVGAGACDVQVTPASAPRSSGCRRPAGAAAARAARGRRAGARGSRGTRTGTTATGCRRGARSPRACG